MIKIKKKLKAVSLSHKYLNTLSPFNNWLVVWEVTQVPWRYAMYLGAWSPVFCTILGVAKYCSGWLRNKRWKCFLWYISRYISMDFCFCNLWYLGLGLFCLDCTCHNAQGIFLTLHSGITFLALLCLGDHICCQGFKLGPPNARQKFCPFYYLTCLNIIFRKKV